MIPRDAGTRHGGRVLSLSRPLRFGACEARLENLLRGFWDDPVARPVPHRRHNHGGLAALSEEDRRGVLELWAREDEMGASPFPRIRYGELDALLCAADRPYAGMADGDRLLRLYLMVSDLRMVRALAIGPCGAERRPVLYGVSPLASPPDPRDEYIAPLVPPLRLPADPAGLPTGYPPGHEPVPYDAPYERWMFNDAAAACCLQLGVGAGSAAAGRPRPHRAAPTGGAR